MKNDPTLKDSIIAALNWARGKAEPYLTWLPDGLEPYVVDAVAIAVLLAAVLGIWKLGADLWHRAIWGPRAIWRSVTGTKPPDTEAEKAAQRIEQKLDDLRAQITAQAKETEESGKSLTGDAVDRAVAAAQEILLSNDPSKAEAQKALRAGNVRAAENALQEAFGREAEAAALIGDEATQLKAKAARTAREKAALAATRSVAEALRWYRKAAELEPEDFGTQIELTRLHQIGGNLGAAFETAQASLHAAQSDRDRSVALNDFGDVLCSQGDLGKALESYQASMVIAERLARADESNAGLQRDLSVSHNKIGDVFRSQGDLGKALESYQASHAIFERLARADESNAGLQRDLSVSHERIGDLQEIRGEIGAAVEEYEESLVIAQSLADRIPDHPQFQSDLEITRRRLDELRAKLE